MRKLGIVGGMGPMATVCFMKRVIAMTDAERDQDHIPMLVEHCPFIPDRTEYILDRRKKNPAPEILAACRRLEAFGVDEIAVPCVTAHYFQKELAENISIPILDGVALCGEYLSLKNFKNIGILATDGSIRAGVFDSAFAPFGINCIYPSPAIQKAVMELIYENVKKGRAFEREKFCKATKELSEIGAQVILLGCTELSVIAEDRLPDGKFLDVLSVLSQKCVMDCGKLKKEYRNLL